MRTFIGVSAPKQRFDIKQMLISTMEDDNIDIRWVKHLNLHLTLKFIGDTPENDIEELAKNINIKVLEKKKNKKSHLLVKLIKY